MARPADMHNHTGVVPAEVWLCAVKILGQGLLSLLRIEPEKSKAGLVLRDYLESSLSWHL